MPYVKAPFLQYISSTGTILGVFPGVDEENPVTHDQVEVVDHVSASGKRLRYVIGDREITEVSFRWQSDGTTTGGDIMADWRAWWDACKSGKTFQYYDDDTIPIAGTGTIASTTLIAGQTEDGDTVVVTDMVVEDTEFAPIRDEVEGYWQVTIRMRKAV